MPLFIGNLVVVAHQTSGVTFHFGTFFALLGQDTETSTETVSMSVYKGVVDISPVDAPQLYRKSRATSLQLLVHSLSPTPDVDCISSRDECQWLCSTCSSLSWRGTARLRATSSSWRVVDRFWREETHLNAAIEARQQFSSDQTENSCNNQQSHSSNILILHESL